MEISGASLSTAATQATSVAIEVQKKTQDIQAQTAETLIGSLPDPTSSVGQNIDVNA
ncbi:MAG: putative motility protein [Porticoccus sp.]|nr:putative motility protein [Porticoccus sp.]